MCVCACSSLRVVLCACVYVFSIKTRIWRESVYRGWLRRMNTSVYLSTQYSDHANAIQGALKEEVQAKNDAVHNAQVMIVMLSVMMIVKMIVMIAMMIVMMIVMMIMVVIMVLVSVAMVTVMVSGDCGNSMVS